MPKAHQDLLGRMGSARSTIFDGIYVSANVGMRKPDLCFYNYVLEDIGLPSHAVVIVDDLQENVLAAQSLGIHGILFESHEELCRRIQNLLGDPVARGLRPARASLRENFSQLLIFEQMQNRGLVDLQSTDGIYGYFFGHQILTKDTLPRDLDTASMELTVCPVDKGLAQCVMDEMLSFVTADGILMAYFDQTRPRVDPVACVNILSLFHSYDRGNDVAATFAWVLSVLQHKAYIGGTRYYASADAFLYFLSRLASFIREKRCLDALVPLLKTRLAEQIGADGDSLSLAMRVLACQRFGISNQKYLATLEANQSNDGG
ncbi:hypothetical protein FE257_010865 [Aspergillus nanangensis]|uniref:Uncharacterized protein n=1 Tax=Aspergillus nanangensis TaxID=2582783 RepID=A0AAD4CXE2_ASPNN|nr:hypothetical protein FE257_010865 [Aspergillus nanangensis]